jgi:predicted O-linked N-acetylglucosamine transferase (SPINDLY family)
MSEVSIQQALARGTEHHLAGRLAEAHAAYQQVLAIDPNHAEANHLVGVLAAQAGRVDLAEQLIRKAMARAPDRPAYYSNLGSILLSAGRHGAAVELYRRAVELDPKAAASWFSLGMALDGVGEKGAAVEAYHRAAGLRPTDPAILVNLGNDLQGLGRRGDAEAAYLGALRINPAMYQAHSGLSSLYEAMGRYKEALRHAQEALTLAPEHPIVHYNLALALQRLGRGGEAVAAYQRAIQRNPGYVQAYNNLATVFQSQGRIDEAIDVFQRALRVKPDFDEAMCNLGILMQGLSRFEEALGLFRQAMALNPRSAVAHSNLIYALQFYWQGDGMAIREELARWNDRHARPLAHLIKPHGNDRDPNRRLHIGFVSPDFRNHVVGRNMLPAFQRHDRANFEYFCYSKVTKPDEATELFRGFAEHWRDIRGVALEEVAAQIREDGIDILVDLTLHMEDGSLLLFARKPAPVQVTFAGYPGSTGLSVMDYRLSDPYLDPPENDALYVEKTVRLPHSFWCFDPLEANLAPNPLPALATGYVTFGCLNTFCKTNEPTFELWSQVLRNIPDSRLLLLCPEGSHRQRTRDFFQARGIDPGRIRFSPFLAHREYFELYHQIDLCLDTLPYNGHSTSLDALWMGVPVVTLVGKTVVGRAGLSQLMNLKLPELITYTPEQFVATATDLARDLPRLQALRGGLRERMERSPLMDAGGFTCGIEAAFREMWRAWCQGLGEGARSS